MHLITWHGAVVRRAPSGSAKPRLPGRSGLLQEPIWLTEADGLDFDISGQPDLGGPALEIKQGDADGLVHVQQDGLFLSAAPSRQELAYDAVDRHNWETFLLVAPNDLADLRQILANRWKARPGLRVLEKSDIRMGAGFVLEIGTATVTLATGLPLHSYARRRAIPRLLDESTGAVPGAPPLPGYQPPGSFVVAPGDEFLEEIVLADAPAGEGVLEVELRARRAPRVLAAVTSFDAFRRDRDCELVLKGETAFAYPPMVACDADRAMVSAWLAANPAPEPGRTVLRRQQRRHVVLAAGGEGCVFDRDGTENDPGLLASEPWLPSGFARRDGRIFVDAEMLTQAPKLAGTCLVFTDSRLDDYPRFLLGSLPWLDAMIAAAPPGARLLIPPALTPQHAASHAFDHRALMGLLGYGEVPVVESGAAIVWGDDVVFAAGEPAALPGERLRVFRDRVLKHLGPPPGPPAATERRRLYLPAQQSPQADDAGLFLATLGLETVHLSQLAMEQRIRLFREAGLVVSDSAAILADILFCHPGTRVLEIMSEGDFAPGIWQLAEKLGHVHGVLSVSGDAGTLPDPPRLASLLRMLDSYG